MEKLKSGILESALIIIENFFDIRGQLESGSLQSNESFCLSALLRDKILATPVTLISSRDPQLSPLILEFCLLFDFINT